MTNGNETIIPHEVKNQKGETIFISQGLTKREYFAAMAMQGMASNCYKDHPDQHIAEFSVLLADALIEALNKTPAPSTNPDSDNN